MILHRRVAAVAGLWLVLLPALRPLVWSGQPTDVPNLFLLVLLAAAITTGLLLRGLEPPVPAEEPRRWRRPAAWGIAFLGLAALGSWCSPLPASAWTLTVGWALHLAVPWALWPAIRRRPHLLMAGLLAGLVGELLLLVGQVVWERPHLAARLAGDPTLTAGQRLAEQYQARIGSWRLEGTFLLANTLATYLLLVVPLALAVAWRARGWWRVGAAAMGLAALVALLMTGSKAGILAGIVAGVLVGVVALRSWRWRGALAGIVLAVLGLALLVPSLRQALAGSAGVRLDYWRAGVALVQERPLTGHGLEGFAVHYPRVKPAAGEETILAHQETLQAAVDLGLPAMCLLLAWWAAVLWSLRATHATAPVAGPTTEGSTGWTVLIGLPLLLLFGLLAAGILRANLSVYPGGPLPWAVALVLLLTAVVSGAVRLPLPSPAACWCAVVACLLHVQADFSLHSMQVVGMLGWVVALGQALGGAERAPPGSFATARRQGWFAAAGLLVLGATTAGIMFASTRGEVLERARIVEGIYTRLRLEQGGRLGAEQRDATAAAFEQVFARAVVEEREAALAADPREGLALLTIRQAVAASRRFPADHDLVFVAVAIGEHLQALLPHRAEALTPILEGLLADWPQDLLVTKALGEHYLRRARQTDGEPRHVFARQAQALAQRAVALYPTHLPLRQTLITAAEMTGDQTTVAEQRAEIARLAPLVHRDNRLP